MIAVLAAVALALYEHHERALLAEALEVAQRDAADVRSRDTICERTVTRSIEREIAERPVPGPAMAALGAPAGSIAPENAPADDDADDSDVEIEKLAKKHLDAFEDKLQLDKTQRENLSRSIEEMRAQVTKDLATLTDATKNGEAAPAALFEDAMDAGDAAVKKAEDALRAGLNSDQLAALGPKSLKPIFNEQLPPMTITPTLAPPEIVQPAR